ncbi:MAG: hypothetical protein AAGH41_01840 [Pseudomonadota bacterium]
MTSTLFLSGYMTAFVEEGEEPRRTAGLFTRKGKLRADASEILERLEAHGEAVASLPFDAVTTQVFRVSAPIGRQVSHTDIADALEAASARAGGDDLALIAAEPTRVLLDGQEQQGTAVGEAAQTLDVDVTTFVSSLAFLAKLEKVCADGGITLSGVMAPEEAFTASLSDHASPRSVIVCDRWHTKVMRLVGEHVHISASVPFGPGHLADDLAVTFSLDPKRAEETARRLVLGHGQGDEAAMAPVVMARLEEWAGAIAEAAKAASVPLEDACLIGMAATPLVSGALANHAIGAQNADGFLRRADPAIGAMVDGACKRSSGALSRSAATALQLEAPHKIKGPIDWLRRNF